METTDNKTGSGEQKNWQEKIADKVTSDNELLNSLIKLLTNPVILLIAVFAFGYWLNKGQKGKKDEGGVTMEKQLQKLKKKYKKMKRKYQDNTAGNKSNSGQRPVHLD